jgi:hypothetical protein
MRARRSRRIWDFRAFRTKDGANKARHPLVPPPDQQSGEKFAAFTYLHSDAQNPICGTVHNVVSPQMLYISGTSGAQFDERARQLRGTDDVMSAITAGAESAG